MILRAWPPGAARLSKLLIGAPTIARQRAGHFVRPPKARSHPENPWSEYGESVAVRMRMNLNYFDAAFRSLGTEDSL